MTVSEYDRCVKMHSDNLYRFALKSLHDSDRAKDIVQESFLRLWENMKVVQEGKEKAYLFTVAYRLIIDSIRYEQRFASAETLNYQSGDGGGRSTDPFIGDLLEHHLDKLPPVQKSLIMLRDYEGYSYLEIAELTSLSEAQVKVYIFRARTALKNSIGNINCILA